MDCQDLGDAVGVDESLRPQRSSRLRDLEEGNFESESKEDINEVEFK